MNPLDLDGLEKLMEKATPGPWYWYTDDESAPSHLRKVDGSFRSDCYSNNKHIRGKDFIEILCAGCGEYDPICNGTPADADLIVALHNAAPALLAEVKRLRRVEGLAILMLEQMRLINGDDDHCVIDSPFQPCRNHDLIHRMEATLAQPEEPKP